MQVLSAERSSQTETLDFIVRCVVLHMILTVCIMFVVHSHFIGNACPVPACHLLAVTRPKVHA